ncbi:hypothetical protein WEI85_44295 [Actinomycetes bacterium KLBMP 9797]
MTTVGAMNDDTDHGGGFDFGGFFGSGFDGTGGVEPGAASRARNDGRCGHTPPPAVERLRTNRGPHWRHLPSP